ncbi:MAG TPA: AMP-binding protein [Acidimicrobiales bacterium]|jgi:fatty-acyl-CoA synthase|nr:AMP-binding protein [Acidimicrobiales bacterium]
MDPATLTRRFADRPALIMGQTGETVTYAMLEERSLRLAQLFRARGLERGAVIAVFLENHPRFLEVVWAAHRAGLYYTTINSHLMGDEAAYIVRDCGAQLVVSSSALAAAATAMDIGDIDRLMIDGAAPGWEPYEDAIAAMPAEPIADEGAGDFMLYSSGTTGRPKGIKRPLTYAPLDAPEAYSMYEALGLTAGSVYLSPAPLYHAAPLAWTMASVRTGATVVVMERFDALDLLELVERHRVTHAQLVPTMFVRLLKLPEADRASHDVSSLQMVVHAAAPCPVQIKHQMIEWWGPIIYEYYSATEAYGATFITSEEWLAHPGSVGRPILGTPLILDDEGRELPVGADGVVWFEGGAPFEYHNDPAKTAEGRVGGRATVGDIGHLDADGYLYLTDRATFMIISGGVNIYPQEIEDVLITHPEVFDVAVIGVPNDDLGEEVKAVVQPVDPARAGADFEADLLAWCAGRLSTYKRPRSFDFVDELPRLDTGKLYKRMLIDRYRRDGHGVTILGPAQ